MEKEARRRLRWSEGDHPSVHYLLLSVNGHQYHITPSSLLNRNYRRPLRPPKSHDVIKKKLYCTSYRLIYLRFYNGSGLRWACSLRIQDCFLSFQSYLESICSCQMTRKRLHFLMVQGTPLFYIQGLILGLNIRQKKVMTFITICVTSKGHSLALLHRHLRHSGRLQRIWSENRAVELIHSQEGSSLT